MYVLNAILSAVQYERPTQMKAVGTRIGSNGPDKTVGAVLSFASGVTANLAISSYVAKNAVPNVNHVIYAGTKGYIRFPIPINAPAWIEVNGERVDVDFRVKDESVFNYTNSSGLRFQAEEVRRCLADGRLHSERMSPEHSILLAELMGDIHKQLEVQFPETDRSGEFKQIPM